MEPVELALLELRILRWEPPPAGSVVAGPRHESVEGDSHLQYELPHHTSVVSCIVHRSVHYTAPIDRAFFALSDPTRRRILELLGRRPATISELAEPFGLTLNGVKKHVGVLEDADLVVTEKVGRARECRLGPAQLDEASRWIAEYRRSWEARLDRFGTYVERKKADGR